MMNYEEFFAWLNTCPTHKWQMICIQEGSPLDPEGDYCRMLFPIGKKPDEEDES